VYRSGRGVRLSDVDSDGVVRLDAVAATSARLGVEPSSAGQAGTCSG